VGILPPIFLFQITRENTFNYLIQFQNTTFYWFSTLFVADQNENPMAQLGHAYLEFQAGNTGIVVMVSCSPFTINRYLKNHQTTYLILTDKGSKVAAKYFQEKQFFAVRTLFFYC
jgi:hypothetical protein